MQPFAPWSPIPKNPGGDNGDKCDTVYNVDYELRRSPANESNFFNIYPVPGESPYVIYIEGVDRRTACPDRAFLQWTEESCAKSNNNVDGVVDPSLYYIPTEPTMAKINLVGPTEASKFIIKFSTTESCGLLAKIFRIAAY